MSGGTSISIGSLGCVGFTSVGYKSIPQALKALNPKLLNPALQAALDFLRSQGLCDVKFNSSLFFIECP